YNFNVYTSCTARRK
nr:RecName: Full=Monosaccharide transporter [Taxus baccata]